MGSWAHPDQIHQQGRLEHPVQTHVLVVEEVLQASSRAVLGHDAEDPGVAKQTHVQVEVLVTHVSQLESREEVSVELQGTARSQTVTNTVLSQLGLDLNVFQCLSVFA